MQSNLKKAAVGFLSFFIVFGAIAAPRPAEAIWGVGDVVLEVGYNFIKEQGLDAIVWGVINSIIDRLGADIVAWINSGFEGSPAFVSNPERFFRDVGDRVAGEFIAGLAYGYAVNIPGVGPVNVGQILCEDFDLQVRAALALNYYQSQGDLEDRYSCRLSEIGQNVRNGVFDFNFVASSRGESSLDRVIELDLELQRQIGDQEETTRTELVGNSGFLNFRECLPKEDGTMEEQPHCTGPTRTPGVVLERQLNQALGLSGQRLTIADEVNEIIGALVNQLMNKVFGADGLTAGYSGSEDGFTGTADSLSELQSVINDQMGDVRALRRYLDEEDDMLDDIESVSACVNRTTTFSDRDRAIAAGALRDAEPFRQAWTSATSTLDRWEGVPPPPREGSLKWFENAALGIAGMPTGTPEQREAQAREFQQLAYRVQANQRDPDWVRRQLLQWQQVDRAQVADIVERIDGYRSTCPAVRN